MRLRTILAWLLLAAAAFVGFMAVRELAPDGSVRAGEPPGGPPPPASATPRASGWFLPIWSTAAAKPRYDQVINGIAVGPTVQRTGGPCEGLPSVSTERLPADPSEVARSPLRIEPKYLPLGSYFFSEEAVKCRGTVAVAAKEYGVEPDRATGRFGGYVTIYRALGNHAAKISHAAENFSPGEVAGRKAVFVRPLTEDGSGGSAIVIAESFGVTVLQAAGLPLSELIRVAQGLY